LSSSEIKIRRSGLVSFAIRLGSTITGLAFVVIVTSNLSPADFGLWQLISRVLAYMVFVGNILYFWTTRFRARSITLGRTVAIGSLIFSAVLTPLYLMISYGVSNLVARADSLASNFHYFLLASPQVPLYIVVAVIEAILWGSKPGRASFGFGIFEIAKVIVGFVTVGVLRLSLTGAILAVIGAQIVQLIVAFVLTRNEYHDRVNFSLLGTMLKTGWIALLGNLQPIMLSFDFLIVATFTSSTLPLAVFGAAFTLASVISYSGSIATGLYAGLLSGRDPLHSTSQVLELQYLFLLPMTVGEIILATPLMNLLRQDYASGAAILMILSLSQALLALSLTFDNVISGTDKTDADGKAGFEAYLRSRMFLVSRINLSIGAVYLVSVALISFSFGSVPASIFGYSKYDFLGICWAIAALGMFSVVVGLKVGQVRKVTRLSLPTRTMGSLILSTIVYAIVLYLLEREFTPRGGEISQALYLLGLGIISIAVYLGLVMATSDSYRKLGKLTLNSLREYF